MYWESILALYSCNKSRYDLRVSSQWKQENTHNSQINRVAAVFSVGYLSAALFLQPCSGLMCLCSSYTHDHKYHSQPLMSNIPPIILLLLLSEYISETKFFLPNYFTCNNGFPHIMDRTYSTYRGKEMPTKYKLEENT
jgi:hypothetical protein